MKTIQGNRNNAIPEESASSAIAGLTIHLRDSMGFIFIASQKTNVIALPAGGDHPAEATCKTRLSKPECHRLPEPLKENSDRIATLPEAIREGEGGPGTIDFGRLPGKA